MATYDNRARVHHGGTHCSTSQGAYARSTYGQSNQISGSLRTPPVSDALARQRLGSFTSANTDELGVEYPQDSRQGIRIHFTSTNPNLGLRYATRDGAWSPDTHRIDARGLVKAECPGRYIVRVKKTADGKYEYTLELNPILAATKIEINGKSYYIPPTGTGTTTIKPIDAVARAATPPTTAAATAPAVTPTVSNAAMPPLTPAVHVATPPVDESLKHMAENIAPEIKRWRQKLSELNPWSTFSSDWKHPGFGGLTGVVRAIIPLHKATGDYHVPHGAERERALITSVSEAADGVLPKETRDKLRQMVSLERWHEGSREVRQFFNRTLEAMNEYASEQSRLSYASDELREKLGLPKGTKVLLAITGAATFGWDEKELMKPLDLAFGDTIRVRESVAGSLGTVDRVASPGDVVVLQAFSEKAGDPLFLSMTVLSGESTARADWRATTFEATYRGRPFYYVHDAIDRPGKERVQNFTEWSAGHQNWLENGQVLQTSIAEKEAFQAEQEKQEELKQQRIAAREAELAQQSAQLSSARDGRWTMGFQGFEITEIHRSNASFRAAETRTGVFTVPPEAGIHIETKDAQGQRRTFAIDSYEQLGKLSEEDRKLLEYVLTTPYENDPQRSVSRITSLFPSQTYRPGMGASLFYSPRFYGRETTTAILPLYQRLTTPETQRKFLQSYLEALKAQGTIGEGTVSSVPARLSASR